MPQELSETDVFVLLAKRRRRLTLRIIQKHAPPLTTIELAKRIGDREFENPTTEDIRAIYLTLYHNHLPQLEEADVVVYDGEVGTVRPGLNFDTLIRVLEGVNEKDQSWSDE